MRSSFFLSFVPVVLLACGGGAPPKASTASSSSPDPTAETGDSTSSPPKPASKYPDIFFEPDCGSTKADGYLKDKSVISKVQDDNRTRLEGCLDGLNNTSGEVRVSFRLDPDGVPRCVEAPGSTVDDEEVIRCVVHVYRSFHYPPPDGGSVRVTDKFSFEISEDDE